jgi:hypothetical protein
MKKVVLGSIGVFGLAGLGWLAVTTHSAPASQAPPEVAERSGATGEEMAAATITAPPTMTRPDEVARLAEETSSAADAPPHDLGYQAIRAPVIDAVRAYRLPPLERRAKILAAIEDSGPSRERWTDAAEQVFSSWTATLAPEDQRTLLRGDVQCFVAACRVSLTFADEAAFQRAVQAFRKLNDPGAPHGGRVQTPAARLADGRLEAYWIMIRPENG